MENYCENQLSMGAMGGGLGADGGMAPYLKVPSTRFLVPLGDVDPIEAAPLTDAGLTSYHAVKRSLSLLVPGTYAVVIGAGGLGHMGVQLLRHLSPATIVAVDLRDEALTLAKKIGADHAVVSGPDATTEIRDITRGKGADVVIDFVGTDSTLALGASVGRQLGHLTVVGLAGGTLPVNFFGVPYEMSLATTYWGTLPELMELIELAKAGHVHPRVHRYNLDDAMIAYREMEEGKMEGRAVITFP